MQINNKKGWYDKNYLTSVYVKQKKSKNRISFWLTLYIGYMCSTVLPENRDVSLRLQIQQ